MKRACCYIIDQNYLFPALVSALSARANIHTPATDVVICCVGASNAIIDVFRPVCEQGNVQIIDVPKDVLGGINIICARFFLSQILSDSYETILYIDADTQVHGSLDALMSFPLPEGKILAARDPMSFLIDDASPHWASQRAYFLSIGLSEASLKRYFNAGVFLFGRRHWSSIASECVSLYGSMAGRLKFHDQDVLNLLLGRDHIDMSFKWNFPVFFENCGLTDVVVPAVRHFMSRPRPWDGAFPPWGRKGFSPYAQLVESHPELRPWLKPFTGSKYAKYLLQQNFKRFSDRRSWNTEAVRTAIALTEAHASV